MCFFSEVSGHFAADFMERKDALFSELLGQFADGFLANKQILSRLQLTKLGYFNLNHDVFLNLTEWSLCLNIFKTFK